MTNEIHLGYYPRPLQKLLHIKKKRFSVLALHRRFGKTVWAVMELINGALTCTKQSPKFAYIAPFFRQAKSVAWSYLKDYTREIPNTRHLETDLKVILPNGAEIQCFGADNPDSLRGQYFDGVVLDEYGQMHQNVWSEVLRPALSDRLGWCVFLGTPAGKNAFYEIYQHAESDPAWYAETFKASETRVIASEELRAARKEMGEDSYQQEYECNWAAAIRGAFYANEIAKLVADGRIKQVPHDRLRPVFVSFDLGIQDFTACWFAQCTRDEIHLIDYQEYQRTGLTDVMTAISKLPYDIGELVLPHDAKVMEMTTGRTRVEVLEGLGYYTTIVPNLRIEDGIQSVRSIFDKCWFDQERCSLGIDRLENYHRKYNERTGEFMRQPNHDVNSHGSDSFRYLAIGYDPAWAKQAAGGIAGRRTWRPTRRIKVTSTRGVSRYYDV